MRKAIKILAGLDMTLSPEKSSGGAISISDGFEFLGIELNNGFIRPTKAAQEKLLAKVQAELDGSGAAFTRTKSGQPMPKTSSLISTLKRVDGIVQGWGKHYRFCNDERCFAYLDGRIADMIRKYLGLYSSIRREADETGGRALFGLEQLALIERSPFSWPKETASAIASVMASIKAPSATADSVELVAADYDEETSPF